MEIGAKRAELRGFLENRAMLVNAETHKLNQQKQRLINMVLYYRIKPSVFGME
jgi:hypothetical protein